MARSGRAPNVSGCEGGQTSWSPRSLPRPGSAQVHQSCCILCLRFLPKSALELLVLTSSLIMVALLQAPTEAVDAGTAPPSNSCIRSQDLTGGESWALSCLRSCISWVGWVERLCSEDPAAGALFAPQRT